MTDINENVAFPKNGGIRKFQAIHAVLIVGVMIGAILTWGPVELSAGMIWSGVCFIFGAMLGISLNAAKHGKSGQEETR